MLSVIHNFLSSRTVKECQGLGTPFYSQVAVGDEG